MSHEPNDSIDAFNEHMLMIEDCENRESRLSSWERDFISSLKSQILVSRGISTKQVEKLNEVWERATEKG